LLLRFSFLSSFNFYKKEEKNTMKKWDFFLDLVSHFYGNFNMYYVCIMVRIRGGDGQEFVL